MNLDERYILVFIRQNMFPDKQMVHSVHLGLLIGKALDGYCQKRHALTGHPNVLVFGVDYEDDLNAVSDTLRTQEIEHMAWADPDAVEGHDDFGVAGIVSEPITKKQRAKLPRFRQWSASKNIHPFSVPGTESAT